VFIKDIYDISLNKNIKFYFVTSLKIITLEYKISNIFYKYQNIKINKNATEILTSFVNKNTVFDKLYNNYNILYADNPVEKNNQNL